MLPEIKPMSSTKQSVAKDKFICCATFIPLRKWQYVFPFTWFTKNIEARLKKIPGFIKSEIRSDINILGLVFPKLSPLDSRYFQKRFWTFTVWQDRESAMKFFAASTHHQEAVKHFKEWTYPTARIVIWQSDNSEIDWPAGLEKLKQSPGITDHYSHREIDNFENYVPGEHLLT